MPSSVLSSDSMHIGLLAAAAHAAATNSRFTIFFNPKASKTEFVIPLSKYIKAVFHTRISVGMRFRMLFETEESSVRSHVDEGDQGVNATQLLHNEPVLVTVSGDGSVGMWDVTLGQPCVRHIVAHTRRANAVVVALNDKYLCTGGSDQKVVSCLFVLLVSYVAYVMSYWKRFYIITEVGVHILIGIFHILSKEMIDMLPEIIELFR
ncbi:hypothetical protein ZEAMMB73_Zm00001d029481 [Zea mays]|uniref:Uncharacterized protein n=2 Tax=Zea mays TaxID=4577 RepID=A0A1D6K5G7_MAIZE|nr:hypothetical protein ZEAMMB73_Zm00001d029481 [Zea mays]